MKHRKTSLWIAAILIAVLVLSGCSQGPAPVEESVETEVETEMQEEATEQLEEPVAEPTVKVVASFYPYYDVVRQIGGALAEIHQMVPDGTDPHSFEPSPRDLILLQEADLFIYNGLEMEAWLEGALTMMEDADIHLIKAGDLVELLAFGEDDHDNDEDDHDHDHDHDHDQDDHDQDDHDHGDWDPHIWTNPINMKIIATELATALKELDPENASVYAENLATYTAAIDELDDAFRQLAEEADQKVMLVSHSAFGYLAHQYGFKQISVSGIVPHAEPNPGRMAELTKLANEYQLEYIFFETLANPKTAEVLAEEAGLTPLMLHNLEGLTREQREAEEDYVSLMQENVETLRRAFER